ncbi:bifunctional Kinesin-like protein/Kinesin motor domain/P-loop containing nucleoside triphosphate hydrolase/Kinesin motor domain [Babesia duncani]|uniref:Kinesin-like protein n=1 Tax=Babesia duncani TaxID=323732 RepID=A0AAD9UQ06_9APIC|nr:bifunctional Kinesin-like protein/Kinesin motor domain/P-loop containing nucleoside triphosphate hydrolase/Kinesin motor domain [Babesia duncani]
MNCMKRKIDVHNQYQGDLDKAQIGEIQIPAKYFTNIIMPYKIYPVVVYEDFITIPSIGTNRTHYSNNTPNRRRSSSRHIQGRGFSHNACQMNPAIFQKPFIKYRGFNYSDAPRSSVQESNDYIMNKKSMHAWNKYEGNTFTDVTVPMNPYKLSQKPKSFKDHLSKSSNSYKYSMDDTAVDYYRKMNLRISELVQDICIENAKPSLSKLQPLKRNVKVVVRVRRSKEINSIISVRGNEIVIRKPGDAKSVLASQRPNETSFKYDNVLDQDSTQRDTFSVTTRPILDSVFDGINSTVFAYGSTGCGKTYTMMGNTKVRGIVHLTMEQIFKTATKMKCRINISYFEIHNEKIYDLLNTSSKKLDLIKKRDEFFINNITTVAVDNIIEMFKLLGKGNNNRKSGQTAANFSSSRSHAILQISVLCNGRCGQLCFIDLAGSERLSVSGCTGKHLEETLFINRSLLALANLINSLSDTLRKGQIKYRESKLTALLKGFLIQGSNIVMIGLVNSGSKCYQESFHTLKYMQRVKETKLCKFKAKNKSSFKTTIDECHEAIKSIMKQANVRYRNHVVKELMNSQINSNSMLDVI